MVARVHCLKLRARVQVLMICKHKRAGKVQEEQLGQARQAGKQRNTRKRRKIQGKGISPLFLISRRSYFEFIFTLVT